MRGLKTPLLYRVIREELQEHAIATGNEGRWLFTPTNATKTGCSAIWAIIYLQVVISTLFMSLHVSLLKNL